MESITQNRIYLGVFILVILLALGLMFNYYIKKIVSHEIRKQITNKNNKSKNTNNDNKKKEQMDIDSYIDPVDDNVNDEFNEHQNRLQKNDIHMRDLIDANNNR